MRYRVIRDKYVWYGNCGIKSSIFNAEDDIEAILLVDEHCGYGYLDKNSKNYEEEGFIRPTLEDAIEHLSSNNGDGADFVFKVENLETGKIIFQEDDSYMEDEEDW